MTATAPEAARTAITEPVTITRAAPEPANPTGPEPEPIVREDERRSSRNPRWAWLLVPIVGVLALVAFLLAGQMDDRPATMSVASPQASIVVGEIGGAVVTPAPTPAPTPEATPPTTPAPTPAPTTVAAPAPPTTPAPTPVASTPVPATPAPSAPLPATPEPTPAIASADEPADTVAAFYGAVVEEEFDAAYSAWSERMREQFPREENLDERFDETAEITFTQLETVATDGERAEVQANFVELYESGATREFIGYWEVVLVDGRWLLDQPHY